MENDIDIIKAIVTLMDIYCEKHNTDCNSCPFSIDDFDTCVSAVFINIKMRIESEKESEVSE